MEDSRKQGRIKKTNEESLKPGGNTGGEDK